jgi:hypothetical protein
MDEVNNAIFSVTIQLVSNKQTLASSILPERFVSSSKAQDAAIVSADLGSTLHLGRQIDDVIIPAIVT